MRREIDKYLLEWKNEQDHKVLVVRGARQIGKTYAIRELGKTFKSFLEINFEKEKSIHRFFTGDINPLTICNNLSAYFSHNIEPGKTLLFFDEIQACPAALLTLRYFYEEIPSLHVIAAGSLLEFTLSEIPSQAVGRLSYLFMYPMNFKEFLLALNQDTLTPIINNASINDQINPVFHQKLINYYKIHQIIGGMPAVVKEYTKNQNLLSCQKIIDELLITIKEDFAKYKKQAPITRLNEVFSAICYQAGTKFKYSNVVSRSSLPMLKESLELLIKAGLAYKVHHSSARGIPLGAQVDYKKFKVICFDCGIQQRMMGLEFKDYLVAENFNQINKGNIAEIYVGLELIANSSPNNPCPLYYWHRESNNSNAEVDYVIQKSEKITPIEVKAGTKGQMQSMQIFLKERNLEKGIRISLENFSTIDNIDIIPLYAAGRILN